MTHPNPTGEDAALIEEARSALQRYGRMLNSNGYLDGPGFLSVCSLIEPHALATFSLAPKGERMMSKPILCVDFDGVIHSYTSGWKGETVISDPPVKGAIQFLWRATEFFDVQIYSSRSKNAEARMAMKVWLCTYAAYEFERGHPMVEPEENYPIGFAAEKPPAFLTIDDRAICFDGVWADKNPADLLNFQPWNKRKIGATGKFPSGVLNDEDEGELALGVARDSVDGLVHLNFGKSVAWLALPPETAASLGRLLLKHAGSSR